MLRINPRTILTNVIIRALTIRVNGKKGKTLAQIFKGKNPFEITQLIRADNHAAFNVVVQYCDLADVKLFLEEAKKAKILKEVLSANSFIEFTTAAQAGKLEVTKLLLDEAKKLRIAKGMLMSGKYSAFISAGSKDYSEVLRYLLQEANTLKLKDNLKRENRLINSFVSAAERGDIKVMEIILADEENIDDRIAILSYDRSDNEAFRSLLWAMRGSKIEAIEKILAEAKKIDEAKGNHEFSEEVLNAFYTEFNRIADIAFVNESEQFQKENFEHSVKLLQLVIKLEGKNSKKIEQMINAIERPHIRQIYASALQRSQLNEVGLYNAFLDVNEKIKRENPEVRINFFIEQNRGINLLPESKLKQFIYTVNASNALDRDGNEIPSLVSVERLMHEIPLVKKLRPVYQEILAELCKLPREKNINAEMEARKAIADIYCNLPKIRDLLNFQQAQGRNETEQLKPTAEGPNEENGTPPLQPKEIPGEVVNENIYKQIYYYNPTDSTEEVKTIVRRVFNNMGITRSKDPVKLRSAIPLVEGSQTLTV